MSIFFKLICWLPFLSAAQLSRSQTTNQTYDIVIKNVKLVDVCNKRVIDNKTIAIKNGRIAEINQGDTKYAAKRLIDGSRLIALPGFVNTHTHLWQHICKGCFPKESLQAWVRIYRAIHYLDKDQLAKVVLAASSEALLSGITTVSDYASLGFNDYAFEVNANSMYEAGLGGVVIWHNPSIFLPDYIKEKEIRRLQEKYKNQFSIWMGQGPLSFHSVPQVYSGLFLAQKNKMNLSEHTMENNQEQKDFYNSLSKYYSTYKSQLRAPDRAFIEGLLDQRKPSGVDAYEQTIRDARKILEADNQLANDPGYTKLTVEEKAKLESLVAARAISPLALLEYFQSLTDFLSIHSVWPETEDIAIMKRNNIAISHNPESNMYLSSGIAPVKEYLEANIPISIGTDGGASNDGINFFSAMREMWNLAKIRALNTMISKNMDEWEVLRAATINGARALKMDHVTGSLDIDKEADITLLFIDELGMSPLRADKIVPVIIYSATPRNVKYVISNGSIVVENGILKKYKEKTLANDLTKIAVDVDLQVKNGKLWHINQNLTTKNFASYWYAYRSVRTADSVNIKLTNNLQKPLAVTVVSSASTFGGGSPYIVSDSVRLRFPENPPEKAFKEKLVLLPGQVLQLLKARTKNNYTLILNNKVSQKTSEIGQVLVLVEDN